MGKGIIAGLAGTVAITAAQMLAMKISGGQPSKTPAKAVNKVLHVKATDEEHRDEFVQKVHWTYGTLWGLARSVQELLGWKGWPATALHFAAIWGTELTLLPSIHLAPPVKDWGAGEIAKDAGFHLVYAVTAGLVYDAIDR